MTHPLELRVLIFEEDAGRWVAQALEKDMAAHGPTAYAALAAVQLVLQSHVNFDTRLERTPLSRLGRAPQPYWDAFERAEPLPMPDAQPLLAAHLIAAISRQPVLRPA